MRPPTKPWHGWAELSGRILAFDYGLRRIGVAVSDPTGTIASPLVTLVRRAGKRPSWSEIFALIAEYQPTALVLGLPLEMSGEESEWTREVRAFGDKLGERAGLPVHWVDERLSSVLAERLVRGSGLGKRDREDKSRIDQTAAALLLRTFLAQQRLGEPLSANDEQASSS